MSPTVLSVRGVSKAFGAVQALREVSVDCRAGEIHALVGENGSGKSTLLGIASGFVRPDEGTVEIGGQLRRRGSPAEARKLGLGIAYQTYSHVHDLSVAENLYLAVPGEPAARLRPHGGVGGGEARGVQARRPAGGARSGSLSLAERQLLEVVKALLAEPKVLLLDEPTTALGPEDVERLHALVLERSRAGVGIVYVSHRLPEVLGIADRVTVLRDGVSQGTFEAAGMSEESLVALMIGRPLQLAFPERHAAEARPRGAPRGLGPAAANASARSTSTSRRARSSGSPARRGTGRCRSSGRSPAPSAPTGSATCNGRAARHRLAARPAPRRGRAAERRPGAARRSSRS